MADSASTQLALVQPLRPIIWEWIPVTVQRDERNQIGRIESEGNQARRWLTIVDRSIPQLHATEFELHPLRWLTIPPGPVAHVRYGPFQDVEVRSHSLCRTSWICGAVAVRSILLLHLAIPHLFLH